jgi:hypothetical protein
MTVPDDQTHPLAPTQDEPHNIKTPSIEALPQHGENVPGSVRLLQTPVAFSVTSEESLTRTVPFHTEVLYTNLKLSGFKGRIAEAYRTVFRDIQKPGANITTQTTLREDMQRMRPLSPVLEEKLTELIALTEVALYSTQEPDEKTVARSEQLAKEIRQNMH